MTITDVLKRAADYVQRGWCQGIGTVQVGEQRAVCLIQALAEAVNQIEDGVEKRATFAKAHEYLRNDLGDDPMIWNDAVGRTQAEVALMLEAAATRAEFEALCAEQQAVDLCCIAS